MHMCLAGVLPGVSLRESVAYAQHIGELNRAQCNLCVTKRHNRGNRTRCNLLFVDASAGCEVQFVSEVG